MVVVEIEASIPCSGLGLPAKPMSTTQNVNITTQSNKSTRTINKKVKQLQKKLSIRELEFSIQKQAQRMTFSALTSSSIQQ